MRHTPGRPAPSHQNPSAQRAAQPGPPAPAPPLAAAPPLALACVLLATFAGCAYRASTLRPDAVADRVLLDVATATTAAQQLLAATIAAKAPVVRGDAVRLAGVLGGYDCLHSPATAPAIPVPASAGSAPVHLVGEQAATCYYDDQMAPLRALDDAIEAFKTGQKLSYAAVRAGTQTARSATKAAVGGLVAIFATLADLKPYMYGVSLAALATAVSDTCYRGSELYLDLACDSALAAALRAVPTTLPSGSLTVTLPGATLATGQPITGQPLVGPARPVAPAAPPSGTLTVGVPGASLTITAAPAGRAGAAAGMPTHPVVAPPAPVGPGAPRTPTQPTRPAATPLAPSTPPSTPPAAPPAAPPR